MIVSSWSTCRARAAIAEIEGQQLAQPELLPFVRCCCFRSLVGIVLRDHHGHNVTKSQETAELAHSNIKREGRPCRRIISIRVPGADRTSRKSDQITFRWSEPGLLPHRNRKMGQLQPSWFSLRDLNVIDITLRLGLDVSFHARYKV